MCHLLIWTGLKGRTPCFGRRLSVFPSILHYLLRCFTYNQMSRNPDQTSPQSPHRSVPAFCYTTYSTVQYRVKKHDHLHRHAPSQQISWPRLVLSLPPPIVSCVIISCTALSNVSQVFCCLPRRFSRKEFARPCMHTVRRTILRYPGGVQIQGYCRYKKAQVHPLHLAHGGRSFYLQQILQRSVRTF
jgi:hypothetical protein